VIQTLLGIFWVEGDNIQHSIDHPMEVWKMEKALQAILPSFVGSGISSTVHSNAGPWLAWLTYWWLKPVAQFLFAMYACF